MQELLLKAASLCKEAADKLRNGETPEKQASEIADEMVTKGFLTSPGEKERYTQHLLANPENIAGAKEAIASFPSRVDAIGELSSFSQQSSDKDAMDSFMYS